MAGTFRCTALSLLRRGLAASWHSKSGADQHRPRPKQWLAIRVVARRRRDARAMTCRWNRPKVPDGAAEQVRLRLRLAARLSWHVADLRSSRPSREDRTIQRRRDVPTSTCRPHPPWRRHVGAASVPLAGAPLAGVCSVGATLAGLSAAALRKAVKPTDNDSSLLLLFPTKHVRMFLGDCARFINRRTCARDLFATRGCWLARRPRAGGAESRGKGGEERGGRDAGERVRAPKQPTPTR